jgi:hypothetical protein
VPTQLQLEGSDLESLLARVRTELGSGARIVRAEKVRSGGVGGFFAKQRFEITVEVDEASPAGQLLPPAPLLDLPGQRPAAAAPALRTPAAPTGPGPATRLDATSVPAPLLDLAGPVSLLDLADRVSATERSTVTGAAPAPAAAAAPAPAAARTATPDRPGARPAPSPAVFTPLSTETDSFADMLARLGVASGEPVTPATAAAPTPPEVGTPAPEVRTPALPASPDAAVAPSTARGTWHRASDPEVTDAPELPALPQQRTAEPTTELSLRRKADVAVRTGAGALDRPSPLSGQLARLGLPEHLQPSEGALYPALVESLRRLPKVPRTVNRAGAVLAVVGPLPLALDVARELARDLGLPQATAVVLATTRRGRSDVPAKQLLRTPEIAAERRDLWRRRRNLTIVAVDAPLTAAGAGQARAFLAALGPVTTYGVVEATRKAHDVGAWTRALGGVQALALTGVEETADPASVLQLGIPVGRLGSRPATPAAWAALLVDRVAA